MSGSPSNGSNASTDALEQVGGEIVREQTVRTPSPMASETTVKTPMPTAPDPARVDTVRTRVPTPTPVDVEPVEAPAMVAGSIGGDVPVSRSNAPTVPELELEPEPEPIRAEPPAVSGEVSVVEPDPVGMFDPRPMPKPRAKPADQTPRPLRDDPPAVSGEVSISSSSADEAAPRAPEVHVAPMTASGPQPVMTPSMMTASGPQPVMTPNLMTASGPQPVMTPSVMTSSGHHPVMSPATLGQRPSTDPNFVGASHAETTGPQPMAQGEATGPHAVMRAGMTRARPDRTLWYVALALVLLAVSGVVLVVARAS